LKKVGRPNLFHYLLKEGAGTTRRWEQWSGIGMGLRTGATLVVIFLFLRALLWGGGMWLTYPSLFKDL